MTRQLIFGWLAVGVFALPTSGYGKSIVVLHTESSRLPVNAIVSRVIQETIGAEQGNQIFEEYMDENRIEPNYPAIVDVLRRKYANTKIDLVITFGPQPYGMLLRYGRDLWPTTPIVFSGVEARQLPSPLPTNMTGVTASFDFSSNIDLALVLQPDLEHVFYIGGASKQEMGRRAIAEQDFKRFSGHPDIVYLNSLPLPSLLERLGSLPSHSVVLFTTFLRDAGGEAYISARICPTITASSNAPVYGTFETYLGCGILGGAIFDVDAHVRQAAALGSRILHGESVANAHVERGPANKYAIDWRQLKKWRIPEHNLPLGTVIMYRDATVWEVYKKYIHIAIAVLAVQSALIILLFTHMRRSKRSDVAVRQLTRRLIAAGEEERGHIARELHDDLGQRLSLVAVQLSQIHGSKETVIDSLRDPIKTPLGELNTVISDVHNLSHSLHSTKLEHLGLQAALAELCAKLEKVYDISIHLRAPYIPQEVASEIALSFYRIAQEALYNAVKHSAASEIQVSIQADARDITMIVQDNGVGFKTSDQTTGIGLATMGERMSILNGTLSITSKRSEGTTLTARAPIKKRSEKAE